ncbi:BQ2448_6977 [Microbotryum intermedium]|uniref:BQ2448_6977 protein n=1 Tax=Microbotryum intermedium TaxID=269621 RepID=A0A238FGW0_9BASI|nr:BQ2448_6977 [Microbotryum intermedium]
MQSQELSRTAASASDQPRSERSNTPTAALTPTLTSSLLRIDHTNPLLVGVSAAGLSLSSYWIWARYLRRIANVEQLTAAHLNGRALRGIVTSVGDADNFRLYHKPWWALYRRVPTTRADLKNQTLHIRLAGVDAPELAHFGNPAQAYSAEALDWLTRSVLGKTVRVELYSKDRYGRVVGMAYVRKFPFFFRRNVSEEMLKQGLATVYTQGGAVHAGLLQRFEEVEAKAKAIERHLVSPSRRRKVGMWAQTSTDYESPTAYKARTRT